jgi:hypothetical protein
VKQTRQALKWGFAPDGLTPKALVLVGLAFAIALWALGYRLSSYRRDQTATGRTAAAKFCVEPRNSAFAEVSQLPARTHRICCLAVLAPDIQPLCRFEIGEVVAARPHRYRTATFAFLIPFRSPPSQRSLLA